MSKVYLIFCPNQIALTIAVGLADLVDSNALVVAIYWENRCTLPLNRTGRLEFYIYSRLTCILLWLRYRLRGPIEILLPHRRLGGFINKFAQSCGHISLVDDGLDTLRDQPNNIVIGTFAEGTRFYTFDYPMPLGKWLDGFDVLRVADLESIALSNRPTIDLRHIDRLIVESPPLGRVTNMLKLEHPNTLLVVHSNPNKRVLKASRLPPILGAGHALEASFHGFKGEIVVGESMAMVFALWRPAASYTLTVWLDRRGLDNLKSLAELISQRSYCTLQII